MFIPSQKLFILAVALLAKQSHQEKVLEVNLAIDEDNHIVSISSTMITSLPTSVSSILTISPTSNNTTDIGTNLVDDLWNTLESDGLTSFSNATTNELNNIIEKTDAGNVGNNNANMKSFGKKKTNNSKKLKIMLTKSPTLKAKDDVSGSNSDNQEKKTQPDKKKNGCPAKIKRKHPVKTVRKPSRKPMNSARKAKHKSYCNNINPLPSIHKQTSITSFYTLPAKTKKNDCLVEQTIVIPPQIISVPTLLAPISSKINACRKSILSSIIDEKYYNCITNYAGTLTTTLTKVSVIPVPTTQVTVSTSTIFAPTTQVIYQAIYTPYTVTTTSTDTMFMVKVTTVCKGSSGCNSCELDSNGMVIPAEQLPPGIFATPLNEINTNLYDIMGYVGINPSSFRPNLQGFYATAVIPPILSTRPIISQLNSFMSAHVSPTTTVNTASNPKHKHKRHRKRFF